MPFYITNSLKLIHLKIDFNPVIHKNDFYYDIIPFEEFIFPHSEKKDFIADLIIILEFSASYPPL